MVSQKLGGTGEGLLTHSGFQCGMLRTIAARLPRPLRFVGVGGLGLTLDLVVFTALLTEGVQPLLAGFLALAIATVLTWRLNRAFTFAASGRAQHQEAMRYAAVTAVAQSASYGVFAILVCTASKALPQGAVVVGAAVGALVSYNGHHLFAFAPIATRASTPHS